MFRRRTLFIVGAGASIEAGLPVGARLAEGIGDMLRVKRHEITSEVLNFNDREIFKQLERVHGKSIQTYVQAARKIHEGVLLSNSIDDFLNIHSKDEAVTTLGKAAIVRAILAAEHHSKLFVDPSNLYNKRDFASVADTWFVKFMRVLGSAG
jgi:hypothetical protein